MSPSQDANGRIEKLFSDIKNIADQPANGSEYSKPSQIQPQTDAREYQREIEALKARVYELETSLAEAEKQRLAESDNGLKKNTTPSAPLLYEKEQVGYVFSNDQLTPVELVSATLPESNKAISAPLVASGQVIGEMQIHPASERAITAEDENLASAVAQQVSLQIQNLRLLDAAERARAEALEATRQFTHQS